MTRVARWAAVLLLATGCSGPSGPRAEIWAADLPADQVLIMTLHFQEGAISGTGLLASLAAPGGDQLTITGTRTADTLDVHYQRGSADPLRFQGWYAGNHTRLVGSLSGGEFSEQPVTFKNR